EAATSSSIFSPRKGGTYDKVQNKTFRYYSDNLLYRYKSSIKNQRALTLEAPLGGLGLRSLCN
ncbi:hypothetical protein, partial [Campylobacter concisus]|uniref:hypothetical protein n=1 Tax=Campylobacter concisus TaxID=199 RepID=UPI001CA54A7D